MQMRFNEAKMLVPDRKVARQSLIKLSLVLTLPPLARRLLARQYFGVDHDREEIVGVPDGI